MYMHIYMHIYTQTQTDDRQIDQITSRQIHRYKHTLMELYYVMLPPSGANSYSLSIKNPNAKYGKSPLNY